MASFRKRGKTWQASVEIGTDSEGKRQRLRKSGFKLKKDAENWAREQETLYVSGVSILKSKQLLKDFMEKWYEDVIVGYYSINSQNNTYSRMNLHVLPALGNYPLDKIDNLVFQKFYNSLGEKGLKASSKKKICETLSSCLRYAESLKIISHTPTIFKKDKIVKPEIEYWGIKELNQYLKFTEGKKIYFITLTNFYTGIRPGEMCGLKWEDISFEEKKIYINGQIIHDRRNSRLIYSHNLKTESSKRAITIPEILINELKYYHSLTPFSDSADYVFPKEDGTANSPDNYRNMFKRQLKLLRKKQSEELTVEGYKEKDIESMIIKDIPFYNLRHSHATLLLTAGENMKVISERMGHSSITITMDTYASVTPKAETKTADLLDDISKGF